MGPLFDRSPRFLRAFDALCAALSFGLSWRLQSPWWAASGVVSTVLLATGGSVHLQAMMQRALRGTALALALRKGR